MEQPIRFREQATVYPPTMELARFVPLTMMPIYCPSPGIKSERNEHQRMFSNRWLVLFPLPLKGMLRRFHHGKKGPMEVTHVFCFKIRNRIAVRDKERNQLDILDFKSTMCTIYDEYVRWFHVAFKSKREEANIGMLNLSISSLPYLIVLYCSIFPF